MREILFRGKRVDNKNWIEGFYYKASIINEDTLIETYKYYINNYEVLPETVGQYTDLLDKDGNKIFEEDILEYIASWNKYNKVIKFIDNGYYITNSFLKFNLPNQEFRKIIGNIHDNPELIK